MPGLSFLFKKRFHPSRYDNQKRIFLAEQNQNEKNEREVESALEIRKEKEIQHYEAMGSMESRDPRTSALKFMYSAPQSKDDKESKSKNKKMATLQDYESKIDQKTGDDEMVQAFRAKIIQSKLKALGELSNQSNNDEIYNVELPYTDDIDENKKSSYHISSLSTLEKELGRKKKELTHEQQQERFAVLKNAPMEGSFVKGLAVKHKPFNSVIRNVQCMRCGEWGHKSGERECPLRDYNPNDYDRLQREDPMRCMISNTTSSGGSSMHISSNTTSSCGGNNTTTSSGTKGSSTNTNMPTTMRCQYMDENGESDPESEFLAGLTRREKTLLLRRLQVGGSGSVLG